MITLKVQTTAMSNALIARRGMNVLAHLYKLIDIFIINIEIDYECNSIK